MTFDEFIDPNYEEKSNRIPMEELLPRLGQVFPVTRLNIGSLVSKQVRA